MDFCFRCGDCCKIYHDDNFEWKGVFISESEYKILSEKLKRAPRIIKIIKDKYLWCEGNGLCPFLKNDGDSYFCSIYNERPTTCRMYHCGKINKNDKMKLNFNDIKNLVNKNNDYYDYRNKMEFEAVKWGNKHGWNMVRD